MGPMGTLPYPVPISGGTTTTSKLSAYTIFEFTVDASGSYTMETLLNGADATLGTKLTGSNDPYLLVYSAPFDPAQPLVNCLAGDDDSGGTMMSKLKLNLTAGQSYGLVVTTFNAGATGPIRVQASGPGNVNSYASVAVLKASNFGNTTADLSIQSNGTATVYYVVVPKGDPQPSAAQIKLGQNSGSAAATKSGNTGSIAAYTPTTVNLSGLVAATAYDTYAVADDGTSTSPIRKESFATNDALKYSSTKFVESSNNTGAIDTSLIITLQGDTFTGVDNDDFVTASKVSLTNVPAGLTAVATRLSSTTLALKFTGTATNHANANDVSNLQVTFANGAFTKGVAANVVDNNKTGLIIDFIDPGLLAYSQTTLTEATANDGSISGSISMTLTGTTFTGTNGAALPGGKVAVSNVPAGLTAVVTQTSATVATLTLTGNATNHANSDDVNNLTVTFDNSAFASGSAATVTDSTRNNLAVDFLDPMSLAYSAATFAEAGANDGSITATATITLTGDTFTGNNGVNFVGASKATVTNLSAGLTATITRASNTTATLAFTGNAAAHANANDVSNLTITFADSAFSSGLAAAVTNYAKNNLVIDFADAAAPSTPAPSGPPPNPFNPAGTSTVSVVTPTGTSFTPGTSSLVTNIGNLDNKVGVSDNGVVVIQDVPKEPVKIQSSAPDNVLFSMPETKTVPVQVGGKQIDVVTNNEPVKGSDGNAASTVLSTKTLTNEQGQSIQALQVVTGQAKFTSSQDNQMVGGLTLSKDATTRDVVITTNSSGSSVSCFKDSKDNSGSISAETGEATIVVKLANTSGKTAGFAADTSTKTITLKEGEVARFNSAGELTGVFAGSISGTAGKTGDMLPITVPANVIMYYPTVGIARIDANTLGRLGVSTLTAFADVADESGLSTSTAGNVLVQNAATGVVELVTPTRNFYGIPLYPLTIDTGVPDGIVRNLDGTVAWTLKGVSVRFAPAVADISKFADDAVTIGYGQTEVLANGALMLVKPGRVLVGRPRFESELSGGDGVGFQWNTTLSRITHTNVNGKTQIFDPTLYDAAQVAKTLVSLGAGWAMTSGLNGTLTITGPNGELYKLLPDYQVKLMSVAGKTPPSVWSEAGGKVNYLYTAPIVPMMQGFTPQ